MGTTIAPVRNAIVRALRANSALKAALGPGLKIHEGFAPADTEYPYIAYSVSFAPHSYQWGSMMIEAGFNISVFAENSVDAHNIDQLVYTTLHDAELGVSGQTTLICRRMLDFAYPAADEEGRKYYQVGGLYEVWTDQLLPERRVGLLEADAVLV